MAHWTRYQARMSVAEPTLSSLTGYVPLDQAVPGAAHYTSIGAKRWLPDDDILSLHLILY